MFLSLLATLVSAAGPGDVNGEGKISLDDLFLVSMTRGLDPGLDFGADEDGQVRLSDLVEVGMN